MDLLGGGIAAAFGEIFGQFYLDGTLHRITRTEEDDGDVTTSSADEAIKVQKDACTERMRQQPGYTMEDVRLLVLQRGPTGAVIVKPNTDCEVSVGAERYTVAFVDQDPAGAYWELRGQAA